MIKRKPLVPTQVLSAEINPIYTVPNGLSAQVMGLTIHNPTEAAITVIINYTPQESVADTTSQVMKRTLQEGESYPCPELVNHTLTTGMSIQASGEGATIIVSGVTFT